MSKLLKIDDLNRGNHSYITPEDECYYFMEYTARKGFSHSDANSLIINFKKLLSFKGTPAWEYKLRAMQRVSRLFTESLSDFIDFANTTLVCIPPSKTKGHPMHDDRMYKTVNHFIREKNADHRELIVLNEDMEAAHDNDHRPSVAELQENFSLDAGLSENLKQNLILFDDVLTTGAHFIACKNLVHEQFPDINVSGIFIARRSIPPVDLSELFASFDDLL